MSKAFDGYALEKIDSPEATAAAYFSHFRSRYATAQDYAAFEHWHTRDQAHRIAWANVERAWDNAGEARMDARILAIREQAVANRRPRRTWVWPAAAALVALVGGGVAYQAGLRPFARPAAIVIDTRMISTDVGQQANFRMADGSNITVNTSTTINVAESDTRREARLKQGEAFFEVARNDRKPFVVSVGGVAVTAIGTAFAVRRDRDEVRVTLVHGKVRVNVPTSSEAPARSVLLNPRMELTYRAGKVTTARVDAERSLSWRQGMLDFDRVALSDAVAEVNRYSRQEIVIASPSIRVVPVSGSFRIGMTRGFLQSLEVAGIARTENETVSRVELIAP
ncbi:FecR family protein [Sphingobium aquiterrae]|uniref:FecR family protein n=1 Tax=Sphingobium aquiterrae TaxID=2038656 RepID=UPI003019EC6B